MDIIQTITGYIFLTLALVLFLWHYVEYAVKKELARIAAVKRKAARSRRQLLDYDESTKGDES